MNHQSPIKTDIGLPEGLHLANHGTYVEIRRSWRSMKTLFFTAFTIFWNSTVFTFLPNLLEAEFSTSNIMAFLPLIHMVVGVGLAYYTLASWVNTTRILIDRQAIGVRHGPLPWKGNLTLDANDVKQLYVTAEEHRNKNSTSFSYPVRVITRDGLNKNFISNLSSKEQALFVEEYIEKYLGIRDEAIPGEIK